MKSIFILSVSDLVAGSNKHKNQLQNLNYFVKCCCKLETSDYYIKHFYKINMGFTTDITQVHTNKAVVTIKTSILLIATRLNIGLTKSKHVVSRCIKYCTEDFK